MIEPVVQLDEVQGVSFPGFRKRFHEFLFFQITDLNLFRSTLLEIKPNIINSKDTLYAHEQWKLFKDEPEKGPKFIFSSLSFSISGLRILVNEEAKEFKDKAFKIGMKKRSSLIGDPYSPDEDGHYSNWKIGGDRPVDAVISFASDDLDTLTSELDKFKIGIKGINLVHHDKGALIPEAHGHEHFGFADGVSQPALRGMRSDNPSEFITERKFSKIPEFQEIRKDFASPGRTLIWPGHIYFGYNRQSANNPREESSIDSPKGPEWANNGTFMVYRRLKQNVNSFNSFVEQEANRLNINKDFLGAKLVGRWKSGTPISRSPVHDKKIGRDMNNYFGFGFRELPKLPGDSFKLAKPDPDGKVCPLGAHIRKVNPRDEGTDIGAATKTPPKLMLRRGITFDEGQNDKGLLFVAFMSSITKQFEFLMTDWINRTEQPRSEGGHDPILAIGKDKFVNIKIENETHRLDLPGDFVIPTGGEYFFTPSISFLNNHLYSPNQ